MERKSLKNGVVSLGKKPVHTQQYGKSLEWTKKCPRNILKNVNDPHDVSIKLQEEWLTELWCISSIILMEIC